MGRASSPPRTQGVPIDGGELSTLYESTTSTISADVSIVSSGKLGLLPKRPVSLLPTQDAAATNGSQNPHQIQRSSSEDDSDGLEYAENPFEEHKK